MRAARRQLTAADCSDAVVDKLAQVLHAPNRSARDTDWPAVLRLIDRSNPSWRN